MDNKTVEISLSDLNFLLELVTRLQKSSLTSSVENHVLNLVIQRFNEALQPKPVEQNNKVDGKEQI